MAAAVGVSCCRRMRGERNINLGTTCEFPFLKWGEMEQNSTPNAFNSGSVREMKHFFRFHCLQMEEVGD